MQRKLSSLEKQEMGPGQKARQRMGPGKCCQSVWARMSNVSRYNKQCSSTEVSLNEILCCYSFEVQFQCHWTATVFHSFWDPGFFPLVSTPSLESKQMENHVGSFLERHRAAHNTCTHISLARPQYHSHTLWELEKVVSWKHSHFCHQMKSR